MWEWLVNYGGFLGLPSAKDIYSLPGRYRQWRQEGQDAEIQRERDLNNLYQELRGGLIPPDPQNRQDWYPSMRSPSSPNYRSWAQPDMDQSFEKRRLLENLKRRGGGFSI